MNEKSLWIAVNILTAIAFIWLYRNKEAALVESDKVITEVKSKRNTEMQKIVAWVGLAVGLLVLLIASEQAVDRGFDSLSSLFTSSNNSPSEFRILLLAYAGSLGLQKMIWGSVIYKPWVEKSASGEPSEDELS